MEDEIELNFDPTDPSSVENAITEMRLHVDAKGAPYSKNPLVAPLMDEIKASLEGQILERASSNSMNNTNQINTNELQKTLRSIENTVNDLRRTDFNGFDRHIKKLARLIHSSELDEISQTLKEKTDFQQWIKDGTNRQGGMVGSAYLEWPEKHEEELGLVIALTDELASDEANSMKATNFAHNFYYNGTKVTPPSTHGCRSLHSIL